MKRLLSYFHPKLPNNLVYMLQQVEYVPNKFLAWFCRIPDLTHVQHRKTLIRTKKAQALVIAGYALWTLFIALLVDRFFINSDHVWVGIIGILASPIVVFSALYTASGLAWLLIEKPRRRRLIMASKDIFSRHKAIKVAILGSYGKTTTKELLHTILSEGRKTSSTPGNKNIATSHARWAQKLTGNEEVLLVEYGEGQPGDIAKFAQVTQPDYAIITGLAPNHLDAYKTLEALSKDIFSIKKFVEPDNIFSYKDFDEKGTEDVKISDVRLQITGMSFSAQLGNSKKLQLQTHLVGRHLLGPLAVSIDLAHKLGLSEQQIIDGVAKTKPFEHRLQPKNVHGAWIIDDSYNGSLEGIRAGLALFAELPAKRKIYVTPGLVDQGEETVSVHQTIGQLIAGCGPEKVVLMQNSATKHISDGMQQSGYAGELVVEHDPLNFYTNISQTIAAGDLVLMQNDWTDNYH